MTSEQVCRRENVKARLAIVCLGCAGLIAPRTGASRFATELCLAFILTDEKNVKPFVELSVEPSGSTIWNGFKVKSLILAQNERWRRG